MKENLIKVKWRVCITLFTALFALNCSTEVYTTYKKDNKGGYMIQYPQNWKLTHNPAEGIDIYVKDSKTSVNFNIIVEKDNTDIEEIKNNGDKLMRESGVNILSSNIIDYKGFNAIKCEAERNTPQGIVHLLMYSIRTSEYIYVITFTGLKVDLIHLEFTIKKICDSFQMNIENINLQSNESLKNQYSNKYFSINYPENWEIVQENSQITKRTAISLQIMQKQINNTDFRPNINIIISSNKRTEPTEYLIDIAKTQNSKILPSYQLIAKNNNITLSGCYGSLIKQSFIVEGYKLCNIQYIIKKADNTTFTITVTYDLVKFLSQKDTIEAILNSLVIK